MPKKLQNIEMLDSFLNLMKESKKNREVYETVKYLLDTSVHW